MEGGGAGRRPVRCRPCRLRSGRLYSWQSKAPPGKRRQRLFQQEELRIAHAWFGCAPALRTGGSEDPSAQGEPRALDAGGARGLAGMRLSGHLRSAAPLLFWKCTGHSQSGGLCRATQADLARLCGRRPPDRLEPVTEDLPQRLSPIRRAIEVVSGRDSNRRPLLSPQLGSVAFSRWIVTHVRKLAHRSTLG